MRSHPDGRLSPLLGVWLFLAALAVEMATAFLSRHLQAPSKEERELRSSIQQLKKRANQLNTPATFAKSAKLLREVNAKEKTLSQLQPSRGGGSSRVFASRGGQIIRGLFQAVAFFAYRERVIVELPLGMVQPLGWVLAWPHGAAWQGGGAIAIIPWVTMSLVVSSFLVDRFYLRKAKQHTA